MKREEVIRKLRAVEPAMRSQGAAGLYLFGSHARNTARADSDVDLFVDKDPERQFGFDEFMDIYETIQHALGKNIAIGYSTRDGLSPFVRGEIESEAVKIF